MPRKMRVQYPGAVYHVMSRGDQRQDILFDDLDRHDFIKTLAEVCQKIRWQVQAFCLMRNHYYRVVETPNANLVAGMQWPVLVQPRHQQNWGNERRAAKMHGLAPPSEKNQLASTYKPNLSIPPSPTPPLICRPGTLWKKRER